MSTSKLYLLLRPFACFLSLTGFIFFFGLSFSQANKENFSPEPLFVCQQNGNDWISLSIHSRLNGIGPKKFVGRVHNQDSGQNFITRLNLTKYYEGRVLFFTSGDLRVRFDRTRMKENKTSSFVQIPNWKIYTDKWTCKGPTFEENPF